MPTFALGLFVALALPAQAVRQVDAREMTIRLLSTDTDSKVLTDRTPIGRASKGDLIVVSATLRNAVAQFGRSKGSVVGNATTVFTIRSRMLADVIVESSLPGGWLRAAGRTRLGARQMYTVTGGRGRFALARGTGESTALPCHCSRRVLLYRLRVP